MTEKIRSEDEYWMDYVGKVTAKADYSPDGRIWPDGEVVTLTDDVTPYAEEDRCPDCTCNPGALHDHGCAYRPVAHDQEKLADLIKSKQGAEQDTVLTAAVRDNHAVRIKDIMPPEMAYSVPSLGYPGARADCIILDDIVTPAPLTTEQGQALEEYVKKSGRIACGVDAERGQTFVCKEKDYPHATEAWRKELEENPNSFCKYVTDAELTEFQKEFLGSATKGRYFEGGAYRDTDEGKFDYEGFLSPTVLQAFAAYMHKHRLQSDGVMRASDNWQNGIPLDQYMKSAWRHFMDLWLEHRDYKSRDGIEEALGALLFNIMGYWHELLEMDE